MSGDPDPKAPPAARHSDLRDLEPAPSGRRPTPPSDWLDNLLTLSVSLPVEQGPLAVARAFLPALAQILPQRAVGLCIADAQGEQVVERYLPREHAAEPVHDPSRLFPELAHEEVLSLDAEPAGSTLHIASSTRPVLVDGTMEHRAVQRAISVIGAALRRAEAFSAALDQNRELRRLQAQVIQAEKLASLGQIVAGVVHELNNPLTSIVAYSDYLRKRAIERHADPEDVERLRRIGEAAERILKFSRDLVAYARPAAELPGPVYIHEVIDKALIFCEHEFSEASVTVERRVREDLPAVSGVAGQLTQVFVNLFTNASHAMRERGGRLVVETRLVATDGAISIEVADDGVGIDADVLDQIFEPFYTTKSDGRGTGLGLSIVRDILDVHGGSLVAQSTVGQGSSFTLTLPLAQRKKSTRPPPSDAAG